MINTDNAIHIISVNRNTDTNKHRHYFYVDGKLLYICDGAVYNTDRVKIILEIYLYDYVESSDYIYTTIKYLITDNNFKYMENIYNTLKKLTENIKEFSNDEILSHNKIIDDYFTPFYYKIKRQNKIKKLLYV